MKGVEINNPLANIGMRVQVIPPNGIPVIGEVVEISNKVKNLITKVRVATKDGWQVMDVEDLVVDAVYIVRQVRQSSIFQTVWNFFKGLFRKK